MSVPPAGPDIATISPADALLAMWRQFDDQAKWDHLRKLYSSLSESVQDEIPLTPGVNPDQLLGMILVSLLAPSIPQ